MKFIYLGNGHYKNTEAYEIDRAVYKGIGRPKVASDYKLKKIVKSKSNKVTSIKKAERTLSFDERLFLTAFSIYLIFSVIFTITQKGY